MSAADDRAPWGLTAKEAETGLRQLSEVAKSSHYRLAEPPDGVPLITPEMLRRIYADEECPDCVVAGHICRPCRQARYEARDCAPPRVVLALVLLGFVGVLLLAFTHG